MTAQEQAARRRVVVKIGTNTVSGPDGSPDPVYMAATARELDALVRAGHEVILVSSGAIGAGRRILGLKEKPQDVRVRQACAAVGQSKLMSMWRDAFDATERHVGQVLLTAHTFERRRSYLNLRNTMEALLGFGVVPVVNENDTVSVEEIDASFGDNDRLSALVAAKMEADVLVVLSDVEGLFTRPPELPGATLVREVTELNDAVYAMAGAKAGSGAGRGGMRSKLEAARIAMDAGCEMVIARGRDGSVVSRVLAGEAVGTRFVPSGRREGRKRWLATTRPRGRVLVDAGASEALRAGKHLLPAGVVGVEGVFDVESVVEIVHGRMPVAKALCGYSSDDLARVKGLQTAAVHALLGTSGSANVTRKGALVLLDAQDR